MAEDFINLILVLMMIVQDIGWGHTTIRGVASFSVSQTSCWGTMANDTGYGVCPVVILPQNINLEKINGVWQVIIP